eukprot:361825-Chlamydomonas_euryale.AAC.1
MPPAVGRATKSPHWGMPPAVGRGTKSPHWGMPPAVGRGTKSTHWAILSQTWCTWVTSQRMQSFSG